MEERREEEGSGEGVECECNISYILFISVSSVEEWMEDGISVEREEGESE